MMFNVYTSYEAYNEWTKRVQGFGRRMKIEADNKDIAKEIAWNIILKEEGAATLKEQRARICK